VSNDREPEPSDEHQWELCPKAILAISISLARSDGVRVGIHVSECSRPWDVPLKRRSSLPDANSRRLN
jgi:hypothetical protein